MDNTNVRCGLEVHSQLNYLKTKLFCNCLSSFSNKKYNENTCPICLGEPGSLPSLNGSAVIMGLELAKSLQMKINYEIEFSRKHYDYPDLPKGFQITQNTDGILGTNGLLPIRDKMIPIRQIQLEEDPAKIIYENNILNVDYNRSGISLIETVTDPVFNNPQDIQKFLTQFRRLLSYLKISDTKQDGAFRVDVNVSVGDHPRVEVKNVGSDSEIIKAFNYEVQRQKSIKDLSNIIMETRHWDHLSSKTIKSREKEELADYKYMKEKNIPKIKIPKQSVSNIEIGLLPWIKEKELRNNYDITQPQIDILMDNPMILINFEKTMNLSSIDAKLKSRFFWQEYLSLYYSQESTKNSEIEKRILNIDFQSVETLLKEISKDHLSLKEFRRILRRHITKNELLETKIEKKEISYIEIIQYLRNKFPSAWHQSKSEPNKINYLVGQGVKFSKGDVNPKKLREKIILSLES